VKVKVLTINAFNRPEMLRKCLESVFAAEQIEKFIVVVVQQRGNDSTSKVIKDFKFKIDSLIETYPSGLNVSEYISNNRAMALIVGFEYWKAQYVVSIEEDEILSTDALTFTDWIFEQYRFERNFRGVNLGSLHEFEPRRENSYSKLRYGLHGPASMITKRTWSKIKSRRILFRPEVIFDYAFEYIIKSGFMITPNASRYLDIGIGGTHTPSNANHPFFEEIRKSFFSNKNSYRSYYLDNVSPNWRGDCLLYNPWHQPKFIFADQLHRWSLCGRYQDRVWRKLNTWLKA